MATVGTFGICCCGGASSYRSLSAYETHEGWLPFTADAINQTGYTGDRYRTLTTMTKVLGSIGGVSEVATVTGTITVNRYNGRVESVSVSADKNLETIDGAMYQPMPPDPGYTATAAAWGTDQSIDLSDPMDLANLSADVLNLLTTYYDVKTVSPGVAHEVHWNYGDYFGLDLSVYWVATCAIVAGTLELGWINLATGGFIRLADIPAFVSPSVVLDDSGVFSPSTSAVSGYQQGSAGFWTASRKYISPLTPGTDHCQGTVFTPTGAGGNADSCSLLTVDVDGGITVDPPTVLIDTAAAFIEGVSTLYPNTVLTGGGCPCVPA